MRIGPRGTRTVGVRAAGLLTRAAVVALAGTGLTAVVFVVAPTAKAVDLCLPPTNPVLCENSKIGTDPEEWDIEAEGDASIQGFATEMSVDVGEVESFKVDSSGLYRLRIYRLGYYGGTGARFVIELPTPVVPQNQPDCHTENDTHLIDCGNWAVSASWAVPSTAVSGMYIAKLTRTDADAGESHIPFIVRNDAAHSGIVFQASDTTWQAYNNYGGNDGFGAEQTDFDGGSNFYGGPTYNLGNRAYKLSYNRPFITRGWENGRDYLFSNEYPMIRFLERNGYDVSYISGIDSARDGASLKTHKVILTAGHDEYWDVDQRANVLAARDAGVNLAFFTGNDNYWKTRYEDSTAGPSTDYRTLVCYKETWADDKIDPSPEWTGTWRDPRFSPPADGGNPENALGGTVFMSNLTDLPLTVTAAEGKFRIWKNAGLDQLTPGTSRALSAHTVGYESNEDLDNGFRPAGLIDMSTVAGDVPTRLQDFGSITGPGTTTHHITLYKAPSGALVFSAGTVQWAWGLDENHDGDGLGQDRKIQQATVNLLADMGVQPASRMPELAAASASTDTVAPTSLISSPAAGAVIANGTQVTAAGTATDAGGGQVGGVEVSVDGGSTWHPANGRSDWTYPFVAHGSGPVTIKSRATDDSGNIETPSAGTTVTQNCPCSIFGSSVPGTPDSGDTTDVELGVKFTPTVNGFIAGVRFYKAAANTGTHTGTLWSNSGTELATGTFGAETTSGWQTLSFANPVEVTAGTTYVASYRAPRGHYSADSNFFSTRDVLAGPLTGRRSTQASGNGVYGVGGEFPQSTYHDENYYVDAVFTSTNTAPPTVTRASPRNLQKGLATGSTVTATFSTAVLSGSATITLKNSANVVVAGTSAYDPATRTITFTPTNPLAVSTSFTATVSGAATSAGGTMAPVSWAFTTDTVAGCPCSLFGTTSSPAVADSTDSNPVEVGTRFTPTSDGVVSGIRFYKAAANTGTHTGTLWTTGGTALATGTFTAETTTGWQTLVFDDPVAVTAGTTYVASYFAPNGRYSADSGFFGSGYTSGSLTAPGPGNGVYVYGSGGQLPENSFAASNYWVDPVFTPGSQPPTVVSTSPAGGASGVGVGAAVRATFSVPVQPSSVQMTLTGPGSTTVPGTVQVSGSVATFTPSSALTASTTYTAQVSGARNSSGSVMADPVSWVFTTASPVVCPCSLFPAGSTPGTVDSGDPDPVELGVRITPATNGSITAMRFYKAAANTGTHVGTLWSSTGAVLARGTFTAEPTSGWTTLTFPTAVPVTAGTTYTASYFAPQGHYSVDADYFTSAYTSGPLVAPAQGGNGVYVYGPGSIWPTNSFRSSNYWVDVTFITSGSP